MLCALTKPLCDAATDLGLKDPVNVLTNCILDSAGSLACTGLAKTRGVKAAIQRATVTLVLRMLARVLVQKGRLYI